MSRSIWAACFACGLAACPEPQPGPMPPGEELVVDHWTALPTADAGTGKWGPQALARQPRRLSVTQLERSIVELTGQPWTLPATPRTLDGGSVVLDIDVLYFIGSSLGRADYRTEYRESLDVTPTFTKLMDNWASESCTRMVLADVNAPPAMRRMWVNAPDPNLLPDGGAPAARRATVLENIRQARLHFQSVYTSAQNAEAELGHLVDVFDTVALRFRAGDRSARPIFIPMLMPAQADYGAMAAVCTLLLTDPEFVTY